MTQRAADDYVSIKRALEQIERERTAALDHAPSGENTASIAGGPVMESQKSVDEYLGMFGWTDALGWHRLPPLRTDTEEPQQIRYLPWLGYDSRP